MCLSVTQVILSLGIHLFENIFDIILNNYLYPFSAKMEQEDACGELTIALNAESQTKSHFLFFLISKLWGGFLIPFLYLLFLSHSVSLFSSNTLFLPLSPFNIHRVLMPPAAGCGLLAGCKNHMFLWLLTSLIPGFSSLCVVCASSFFSHYIFLLCYLSDCLYFLTIFLCHLYLITRIFVLASFSPPTFSISLSDYVLSASIYIPFRISEFLGSCLLVCFTGSVSVAHPHPLTGGMFSFTEKHTKCSPDCPKKISPGGGQPYWTAG